MTLREGFLNANFPVVIFVYGLAFFMLGFAVALKQRSHSQFKLAKRLWLLSTFAIIHGLAEWGLLFIPIQQPFLQPKFIEVLWGTQVLLWSISFLFLFIFGVCLITDRFPAYRRVVYVPVIIFVLWLIRFTLDPVLDPNLSATQVWYSSADLWSRYLLAFPGSVVAGIGLMMQRQDLRKVGVPLSDWYMGIAVMSLFGYGLAEGMVVPAGDFFPAAVLNNESVIRILRIPIQLLRALLGVIMAFSISGIMEVFNAENERQLQQARRQKTLIEERGRISRDLHDGVIQSLYSVTLSLQKLKFLNREQPENLYQLKEIIVRVDQVMQDIRDYIRDLSLLSGSPSPLVAAINFIAEEFRATTKIQVEVRVTNDAGQPLTPQVTEHLYFIMKEALSNIAKHSKGAKVRLECNVNESEVELTIVDDGVGFSVDEVVDSSGTCHGICNMRIRVGKVGGTCRIVSSPGEGTKVKVIMPREGKGHASNQTSNCG